MKASWNYSNLYTRDDKMRMDNWRTYHPQSSSFLFSDYNKIITILESLSIKSDGIRSMCRHFEFSIKQDADDKKINNELIVIEIAKAIQIISEKVLSFSKVLQYLQDYKKYDTIFRYPEYSRNFILDTVIKTEKIELGRFIADLTISVQSWTTLHQKELLEVEQELEKQVATTENLSGQGAIDVQRVRLHEHIENLDKIRNTL